MSYIIHPMHAEDIAFLWDMLYEAAAVNEHIRVIGKQSALAMPENRKYLEGWDRLGDAGVVAVAEDGQMLGAAWYRCFPAEAGGYGFIAPDVPELSIGVAPAARGQGVGSGLLDGLLTMARQQGYRRISLSVDRKNPALRLYQRHGFRDAGVSAPEDSSVTMVADL